MASHKARVIYRVPYADTDRMGVVYYSNYLAYFERGRSQLLRDHGFPYLELERRGYGLPVIEAHVEYKAPAGYEDVLEIYAWLGALERVRLRVDCEVVCEGRTLAKGYTVHAFVELETMHPVRVLPELAARIAGGSLADDADERHFTS